MPLVLQLKFFCNKNLRVKGTALSSLVEEDEQLDRPIVQHIWNDAMQVLQICFGLS